MTSPIIEKLALGFPWVTADPFLFCVHHDDAYPAGTEDLGPPTAALVGRNLGQDFEIRDGWRMYHGELVPGFPAHPHRGFETVTIVRRGLIDHSDSLGATARFGKGDVQWLTAGAGIVHCEMFPLVNSTEPNPLELFQIWLNLPASDKLVDPHFSMLWAHDIPRLDFTDDSGKKTAVTVVAGTLGDRRAPPPPPKSWASRVDTDVAIWTIEMEPGAKWTLPPTKHPDAIRTLYLFRGESLTVAREGGRDAERIDVKTGAVVDNDEPLEIVAGREPVDILMLQGRPIAEPVVQHGPFVMNTRAEIQQAMLDYQRTRFGNWPWKNEAPVHAKGEGRFAKHADGRLERADKPNNP